MRITIDLVANGAIVRNENTEVFEYDEDDMSGFKRMIFSLIDQINPNQKYDRQNFILQEVHGRGYECKEKNCPICKGEL